MALAVKDWDKNFETAESRKLKSSKWVPVPNKHDGKGFARIARNKKSCRVLAGWLLILQVASKCPRRGLLVDEDGALDANDLADMTRFPADVFEDAIPALLSPEVGWLIEVESEGAAKSAGTPGDAPGTPAYIEGEGREGKGRGKTTSSCTVTWDRAGGWQNISPEDLSLWKTAYPACELSRQLSEMHDWLLSNPAKARKSNWRRFISNWLKRSQDRGGDATSNGKGSAYSTADVAHEQHIKAVRSSERNRAKKRIWELRAIGDQGSEDEALAMMAKFNFKEDEI